MKKPSRGAIWLILGSFGCSGSAAPAGPRLVQAAPPAHVEPSIPAVPRAEPLPDDVFEGRSLGLFRNTYYDFPQARDYAGEPLVAVFDRRCNPLARVPQGFHDAVCVQGSGQLAEGGTISFARRDCECARVCPRTAQRICFEALDPQAFPFGRGALGLPVVPLSSVAVDSELIALGTSLYIPEFAGLPRGAPDGALHDGCFVAHDRGIKVRGPHVDIFTGGEAATRRWNELVPSNRGVTVIVDSPKCRSSAGSELNALRPSQTASGP